MKKLTFLAVLAALAFTGVSCEDLVNEVDQPIDTISEGQLNAEGQIPFVITGVEARFSTTYDRLSALSGLLSDELFFDQCVINATFPTFDQIDDGQIELDNNTINGIENDLGELRFFADDLVSRAGRLDFQDATLESEALFTGYFYGALARYFYATYFGIDATTGGGIISNSPTDLGDFIPSAQMYQLALDGFASALTHATPAQIKIVNSFVGRTQLFLGNNAAAETALAAGLADGDAPFLELHNVESSNYWWAQAGRGRTQIVVDNRFNDYLTADPNEASRIVLEEAPSSGAAGCQPIYYRQALYTVQGDPLPVATWQLTTMYRAEIAWRASDAATALNLVNSVRVSRNLAPLGALDEATFLEELDKEGFTMGQRLVTQRRFDAFHLPAGRNQYLLITQNERNINPNVN